MADRMAREKDSAAQVTPLSHQAGTRVPLGLGRFAPLLNFDAVHSAPGPTAAAAAAAAVEGPKARFPPPTSPAKVTVATGVMATSSGQGAAPGAAGGACFLSKYICFVFSIPIFFFRLSCVYITLIFVGGVGTIPSNNPS